MEETEDDRLMITFYAPSGDSGNSLQRVTEYYDCFEIEELLKLYNKIKSQILTTKSTMGELQPIVINPKE